MNYRLATLEYLFAAYEHENGRNEEAEATRTKALIRTEILRRVSDSVVRLENAESAEEALQIYKQFHEPY